jgi:hypothetical protein
MNRGAVVRQNRWKAVWGARAGLVAALAVALSSASCGKATREGQSPAYLIVNALEGASGADPQKFGGTMFSDVVTVVDNVPTIFSDLGRVRLALGLKNAGTPSAPTTPTTNNFVTVERYHVQYVRADGRNTPGVDVPYPFDGAMTMTVGAGEVTGGFEIVRHIAKEEAPLQALIFSPVIISTIGEVTFYGHDQTGREVSVTAKILIEFGNFGDPQ